jgi:hypothetical protein
VAAALAKALEVDESGSDLAQVELLAAAVRAANERLPASSAAQRRTARLLADQPDPAAWSRQVRELVGDLTFRPVAEAELPAGVPGFQALDELEIRVYPAYRMVRTDMRGGSIGAFWPLFQHISSRDISMTTPVQVDYAADSRRATSMAFLYGSPDLGAVGKDGRVEVVDVPPVTVLTIGARGYDRPSLIAELRERLEGWLATDTEWQAAGPLRTMGYNSPSVRSERRYFEVQLPIRRLDPAQPDRTAAELSRAVAGRCVFVVARSSCGVVRARRAL